MNKINRDIKLALETGVLGGSLCIISGEKEIAYWEGSAEISKSEDVLQAVEAVLKENLIEKRRIEEIIISIKPGSLTGLRIGKSIALGLKNAFDANIREISLLERLLDFNEAKCKILAAIPAGRNKLFWMDSESILQNHICSGEIDFLKNHIRDKKIEKVLLHNNLIDKFEPEFDPLIEDVGLNMARYLH